MDERNTIYVEPTNRCNLACLTCIRHAQTNRSENMTHPTRFPRVRPAGAWFRKGAGLVIGILGVYFIGSPFLIG